MEGVENQAFEEDAMSDTDDDDNDNAKIHPSKLQIALQVPTMQQHQQHQQHHHHHQPTEIQHYSTLGHPVRHILKVDKICNSAPCTLDKKNKNKKNKALNNINNPHLKHFEHSAPVFIITEPWVNNNSILVQYHKAVFPSPTLRAHELAILATPLTVAEMGGLLRNSKTENSTLPITDSRERVNGLDTIDSQRSLDCESLRFFNTIGRRKSTYDRRKACSKRWLILSIILGACAVVLVVVIVITWQVAAAQATNTQTTISPSNDYTTSMQNL